MKFKINQMYYGFKLLEEEYIDEIQSKARVFQHERSGARLFHLENDDDNKVFSIGFRTPPSDDTGVAHIVEHCVLSGSRKYTTKEPFMDLVKGSLQTFLNAMTFYDKTIYPVASKNDKDFFNLMDVYLDSVFFPKIYEKEEIFMQEGWHHELFEKDQDIEYKGVVYNEMLGSSSSPESILPDAISKAIYPDTCYRYSSGGDPYAIPELSYRNFLDFHQKYYHPSNSYIYLYGNGDIEEQLKYLDDNYLGLFDKRDIDSTIAPQKSLNKPVKTTDCYNISSEEEEENKDYLAMTFVLGDYFDPVTNFMGDLLGDILVSSAAAPIKTKLLEKGIGEDIFPINVNGIQASFGVVAKNTRQDQLDEFENTVIEVLEDLVKNGIDKDLLRASLGVMEYDLREASGFPTKGLIYLINSFESWLYDRSPMDLLRYNQTLDFLKSKIDTSFFEDYIQENILNNNHRSSLVLKAKKGLAKEKQEQVKTSLKKYKNSLSSQELDELIEKNIKLKEMQMTDDSQEDKDTIPRLEISDLEKESLDLPQEVIKEDRHTILYHDVFTSGISYINFLFDTSMVAEEDISYLNILSRILGDLDTENYSYSDLDNSIYINTGGISLTATSFSNFDDENIYHPKLNLRTKTTRENMSKTLELVEEILFNTKIEDSKRIKEILQKIKSRIEMGIFQSGNSVASGRLASYFSPRMNYNEKISGLDYYWFLSDLLKDFDEKSKDLLGNLDRIYREIFNINNLIIGFTGDKEDFTLFKDQLEKLLNGLNQNTFKSISYSFKEEAKNEGIKSTSNVQYVAKGYNFINLGHKYSGSMNVLSTILNVDYLHNKVRAQGGAYGVGLGMGRTGSLMVSSYRDPNIVATLDAYDKMADFVENIELDDQDLISYIVGAIGSMDSPMTPSSKGALATSMYITNTNKDDMQKIRDQVISTKISDIKALAPILKDTMDKGYICVLGNENIIEENKNVFNNLVNLNK